jgi:hypothetical protein
MNQPLNTPSASKPAKGGTETLLAVLSLVCGLISLCGVVVPFAGIPFGLLGLVLGYFGRRSAERKNLATIGMVLGGLGVLLSCVPIFVIYVMRLLGPKVGNTFSTISSSLP